MNMISCFNETEAHKQHKRIEKDLLLAKEKVKENRECTILLLGAEDSGKTTLTEQLKFIYYKDTYLTKSDERKKYIPRIAKNILDDIKVLIEQASSFNYPLTEENQIRAQKIGDIDTKEVKEITTEIGEMVTAIWKDPSIQLAFSRSSEYFIDDSAKYFFENIPRIATTDFVPSDDDVLRSRATTTNLQETEIQIDDIICKLVEVGEQQSDRRKWITWFENAVDAIFYFVDVSKYDAQVTEENNANFLRSCIRDFTDMWNLKWTHEIPVFLFFNKTDLFKEKLSVLPMNHFFLDFTGSDFESAAAYLTRLFRAPTEHLKNSSYSLNSSHLSNSDIQHPSPSSSSSGSLAQSRSTKFVLGRPHRVHSFKKLQVHWMCALNRDNVQMIFKTIRNG